MAKKPTTRVFQLAKELGVTSKDVVAKCQAENIPSITNHMSAVSVGLAATIREWFDGKSAGGGVAVETAAPVDLAKVRKKASKKKAARKKVTKPEPPAEAETAVAVAEPEVVTLPPVETAPTALPAIITVPAITELPPHEIDVPDEAPAVAAAAPEVEAPPIETRPETAEELGPVMNVPQRPDVISPAGPKLEQPVKTTLSGPKVIRVDAPETVPVPRARERRPEGPGGPSGPRAGRGVEAPDAPGTADRGGRPSRTTSRRNKRRSATARDEGGRTGRASTEREQQGSSWRQQDLVERERRLSKSGGFFRAHRRDNLKRSAGGQRAPTVVEKGGSAKVAEPIYLKELSAATGIRVNDILRALMLAGNPVTINTILDASTAIECMLEFGVELEVEEKKTFEAQIAEKFSQREVMDEQPRPPVITILGHVDHGKTSLLDKIRNASVAEGEAGGITQATSAFQVPVEAGDAKRLITFIDTPGHEAFTEMRSRGAKVTDIVVLVVAADDGVMPQTVESINHAKAADVPIVVALNKIDKPEATDSNIQRILGQLAEHELNPVDWGGSTEVIRTSATAGEGIQDLLEVLDYQAQLLEVTADHGGPAEGTVIESSMKEGRGAVASVLVQQGCLKKGDYIVVGRAYGRVRDLVDDHGHRGDQALPSVPVAVSGLNEVPDAGDKFYCVKSLKAAEAAAEERKALERERDLASEKITLDNIFAKMTEGEKKELPIILKTDVQGSCETIVATLTKMEHEEVLLTIKHASVGGINESDVLLAEASGAVIIGFNVTSPAKARKLAETKRVDVRLYDVIYDITDDIKAAIEGLLEPEHRLEVLGHADVREVFKISKVGMIAGCYVTDGTIERNAQIRITRDDIVIEKDRRLEQLKRFKDDAKEVRSGQECGMKIEGYDDIKVGDVLECYKTTEVRRTL